MVMSKQDKIQDVTAVEVFNGVASITENTMTNMTGSIIVQSPQGQINLESNEIESNSVFTTVANSSEQISVWNANGAHVYINSNELKNNRDVPNITRGAILVVRSVNVSIEHNVIDGFDYGISTNASTAINISENVLSSIDETGIFLSESQNKNTNYITCNDVTMVMGQGVSVWTKDVSRRTQISSNCLKDGSEGIRTDGSGTIPVIRNNYLYNYQIGVNNIGHSGNIGSSTDPGMNTFWSNNNSAFDVASTTSLDIADNFGMFNCTWAFVNITGNNPYHSTASCGHQIFNMPSQGNLNTKYQCDNKSDFFLPIEQAINKFDLPTLNKAFIYLSETESKLETINKIASLDGCSENYLISLTSGLSLSDSDLNKIWFNFYKLKGQYTNAMSHLNNLDNEPRMIKVESLYIKLLSGVDFTETDLKLITTIAAEEKDGLSNLAVSLSRLTSNHEPYLYEFPNFESTQLIEGQSNRVEEDQIQLTAFPNPFTDGITVQVLAGITDENQELFVFDLQGQVVLLRNLNFVSGQATVDLSALSSGTYFIVLSSEGKFTERTKVVKN